MTQQAQHIHGGTPAHYFEKFGLAPRPIVDYSVNVSPLGPPEILEQNWRDIAKSIAVYPSINGDGIADYYMSRFSLNRENILPGNGSTECLYLAPRVLGFKRVAIVTPSFHDYERSCQFAGAEILELPLTAENSFAPIPFEGLSEKLTEVDAIMLGSPNNPTNTRFDENEILSLADKHTDKWILVDEAFIQFIDDYEHRTLIQPDRLRKNILVFHSLTKFYDIPGIRLGCVVSHAETIEKLAAAKEPWTVNGIAEQVAGLLTDVEEYEQALLNLIQRERSRLFTEISEIHGITLYPSQTNYFLARWTASDTLDDLIKGLLEAGFYIRDCRNFRHLESNYFRFTVLRETENLTFISALKNIAQSV